MNIKIRVRDLKEAMVISRAASAAGLSTEQLAKRALYKEVSRIYNRIQETLENASTGNSSGDSAAVSGSEDASSPALANPADEGTETYPVG